MRWALPLKFDEGRRVDNTAGRKGRAGARRRALLAKAQASRGVEYREGEDQTWSEHTRPLHMYSVGTRHDLKGRTSGEGIRVTMESSHETETETLMLEGSSDRATSEDKASIVASRHHESSSSNLPSALSIRSDAKTSGVEFSSTAMIPGREEAGGYFCLGWCFDMIYAVGDNKFWSGQGAGKGKGKTAPTSVESSHETETERR
ncbi:hypothetical protein DFH07DRAFT_1060675 [Mycena maculata]|uniref:Uncharacterized protein n=1 Tax=Mycena maculata TaxID=230809 RepID=A0AAD7J8A1_9AGAR|nr:hypothetical protein DFH07DRAFT_1060675 [Mycena maculata]